jgi:ADP-sugar diphosphatase
MILNCWQVEEETGIKLNLEDMVDLTALLDPATGGRMLPSPVTNLTFPSVYNYVP